MVEKKSRARLYFVAFLLPAFALYTVFFVYPFFRGFAISLTNWDGLTPRAPNLVDSRVFEEEILPAVSRAGASNRYSPAPVSKRRTTVSWD